MPTYLQGFWTDEKCQLTLTGVYTNYCSENDFQITGSTLPTRKSQSSVPIQVTIATIQKGHE